MSEPEARSHNPQEKCIRDAEAIMNQAQEQYLPRHILEAHIKDILKAVSPYSLSAAEIAERHGIAQAAQILEYLRLFKEVEKTRRGHYRLLSAEDDEAA